MGNHIAEEDGASCLFRLCSFCNAGIVFLLSGVSFVVCYPLHIKGTRSVTMNIFRKKYFLFKSFVKIEFSYVFTINMFSTAESCMEQ